MVVGGSESDNDDDWEEVDVPQNVHQHIEITLNPRQKQDTSTKKKGLSHADRLTRIHCHKIHSVCLLANGWTRNAWINDPLLHARLLSLTPLSLQNAFAVITKSRVPDQNQRGRLFEAAINRLTEWWTESFFQISFSGHIRNRTFDDVQAQIAGFSFDTLLDALEDSDCELIRSSKSLMKHALMRTGSRDTGAQLFTALCRALGIPARLVVSLQSVPWQAGVGRPKPATSSSKQKRPDAGKGKGRAQESSQESEQDDETEHVTDLKGKGKAKQGSFLGDGQTLNGRTPNHGKSKATPLVKLRKSKSKGYTLGSSSTTPFYRQQTPDPSSTAPIFWTEVFSRPDTRWLPVDPIRNIVNKRKAFDPTPSPTDRTKQENRMVYVVAFEEDGYARDVTPRYAKDYGAKVAKMQEAGGSGGGGRRRRKEWWERVIGTLRRPYRLLRDDLEDEELEVNQMMEGMPTSMAGFKDHPLYVLVRHLKRDEVIHPLIELGKFRGEPVYARSAVISLKTAENWMRSGRKVKAGCQPMKWVKQRAATVNKQREIELAVERSKAAAPAPVAGGGASIGDDVMQGLYALSQTELYKPDPVVNGRIPKNDFGNIDLYVPSMLPDGAVHVPFKGTAKIARNLGFDYAEAVTGFEFKKRKAFPVIEGVVVAAENETILLEAYLEAEQDAEERARVKRHARVIKLWTRLVQGLRIRQRLQEEYVDKPEPGGHLNTNENSEMLDEKIPQNVGEGGLGGGFLIGADDVVQPYRLPRYQYQPSEPHSLSATPAFADTDHDHERDGVVENGGGPSVQAIMYALETMDDDQDLHSDHLSTISLPAIGNGVPKTMREMAEDASRTQSRRTPNEVLLLDNDDGDDEYCVSTSPATKPITTSGKKTNGKVISKTRKSTRTTTMRKRGRANLSESEDSVAPSQEGGPSPAKRGKGLIDSSTPTSGRILRPRSSKSAAKIKEEKDLEEAFRRATAG